MVFSSLVFLFGFLPLVLVLYYAVPSVKWKNPVLFVFSLLFYAWGEPVYIFLMLGSILYAYLFGFLIDKYRNTPRSKWFMILSVAGNLSALVFFKYAGFLLENFRLISGVTLWPEVSKIAMPIGISFYTFQIISYTVDLYWGRIALQKNLIAFGTYVTLFPQLIAGPIVRYRDIDEMLLARRESFQVFSEGIRRFTVGLAKKVILGDTAAALYTYFASLRSFSTTVLGAWGIMIFFTLHIYFDFSGYSDMAIGLGKMFGFRFEENFRYPYMADSITDFWRRWHISLSSWFREYVYIPLGGNRNGYFKQLRNIAVVWLLTGFWHGASWNFVLWGVYFGIILILEKMVLLSFLKKIPGVFRHLYALLLIGFGWILFSFTDLGQVWQVFLSLFGGNTDAFTDVSVTDTLLHALPFLAVAVVGTTSLPNRWFGKIRDRLENSKYSVLSVGFTPVLNGLTFGLFLLCIAYIVDSGFSPFLYFNF